MHSSDSTPADGQEFAQNVIMMRHGHRLDNFDAMWLQTAERPWDPPLVDAGRARAFCTGRELRPENIGFQIHRVFVSPFLRCIQTATEVVTALCAVDVPAVDDESVIVAADGVEIDPSKVKVAIEYGLCEMLCREAIRATSAPKDGNFGFVKSDLESLLPDGTIDHTVEPIYPELPRWEETVMGARDRYEKVIQALADKYPSENLLLISHGEGVATSITSLLKGSFVYEVDYCAYSQLSRRVVLNPPENSMVTADSFNLVTSSGRTGVRFHAGYST